MVMLAGGARTATVEAVEPCEVLVYAKVDVNQVLDKNPAVKQALVLIASRRRAVMEQRKKG